jgi:signal transduction histidine kinase
LYGREIRCTVREKHLSIAEGPMSDFSKPRRKLAAAFFLAVALPCTVLVVLGIRLVEADRIAEEQRREELTRAEAEDCARRIRRGLRDLGRAGADLLQAIRDPAMGLAEREAEGADDVEDHPALDSFVIFGVDGRILGPSLNLPYLELPEERENELLIPFNPEEDESLETVQQRYIRLLSIRNTFQRALADLRSGTNLESAAEGFGRVFVDAMDPDLRGRALYRLAATRMAQGRIDDVQALCDQFIDEGWGGRAEDGRPVRGLVFLLLARTWQEMGKPGRELIELFRFWDDLLQGLLRVDRPNFVALGEQIAGRVRGILKDTQDLPKAWTQRLAGRLARHEGALRRDDERRLFEEEVLPNLPSLNPLSAPAVGYTLYSTIFKDRLHLYLVAPAVAEPDWEEPPTGAAFRVNTDHLLSVLIPDLLGETGSPQVLFDVLDHRGQSLGRTPIPQALRDRAVEFGIDEALPSLRLRAVPRPVQRPFLRSRGFVYTFTIALAILVVSIAAVFIFRLYRWEEKLLKLRSDFVSNVTHELRTPLTAITMFADTLRFGRVTDPEKVREYYEIIHAEAVRLGKLIENVLDFSRIEAGRKTCEFQDVDAGEVTQGAVSSFSLVAKRNRFEIELSGASEPLPLKGDPEALERVIVNLLSNAMKFSTRDRRIRVRVLRRGDEAVLEVEDRGRGIPPEEQERIFQKFYRIEREGFEKIPGTGLGLSLVQSLTAEHGGRVEVTSEPGQGSCFRVFLPLIRAAEGVPGLGPGERAEKP